jgi:hypothetical protein
MEIWIELVMKYKEILISIRKIKNNEITLLTIFRQTKLLSMNHL